MVTIPTEYRRKLGITEETLLSVQLMTDGVKFTKVEMKPISTDSLIELYSDEEVEEWLKNDQLDKQTIKKLNKLLGK